MSVHSSSSSRRLASAAGMLAAGLLLTACGGGSGYGNDSGSGSTPSSNMAAQKAAGETVQTGDTEYGDVLVDAKGRTLYVFAADSPGKSTGQGTNLSGGLWWVISPDGTKNTATDESDEQSDTGVGGGY